MPTVRSTRRLLSVLRWGILIAFVLITVLVTPPVNPTGRVESSRQVTTGGSPAQIGASGERALAQDLDVVNNNVARVCVCDQNRGLVAGCNACAVNLVLSGEVSYRVPDFITSEYIADAKNVARFPDPGIQYQITDFIAAAHLMHVPLWIYVRRDTEVDPTWRTRIEETGGGVIRYFRTSPIYAEPLSYLLILRSLLDLLTPLVGLLVLVTIMEWVPRSRRPSSANPPYVTPTRPAPGPAPHATRAEDRVGAAAALKERARQRVDRETARDDLRHDPTD